MLIYFGGETSEVTKWKEKKWSEDFCVRSIFFMEEIIAPENSHYAIEQGQ